MIHVEMKIILKILINLKTLFNLGYISLLISQEMKTLLLIRHAKSSWNDAGIDDFDRSLNERGKKNAPEMARRLIKNKTEIDLFVSSPAKRAKTTAQLFMREFSKNEKDILLIPELYHADEPVFYSVISRLEDEYQNVAVFSHNPGITAFANSLTEVRLDNMPTCSIFGIRIHAGAWKEFKNAKKEFLFFDYPKSESLH
jgi:phosphohistidine phosphatase